MARSPEKDTLRQECANTNKTLANKADLVVFGHLLNRDNFLSGAAVTSILDIAADSKYAKTSKLMMAVDTHITTTGSQATTTEYFNKFLHILYEDLELEDLARKLADTNKKLSGMHSLC